MLAAFGRPVMAQLHEHEDQHKDIDGGASWWRRATMELSELWHSARDWVQNKWGHPAKEQEPWGAEPKAPHANIHGPEIER